jgi:lipoprotein-releasing system ATP-binding protein
LLVVENLSKEYPTPRGPLAILSGVNLQLARGEAAAVTGPSGSGKSTLLYVVGALEPPTEGRVTLDGRDPFAIGERELAAFRNREIGFIFQDHYLLPQLTVLENVLAPTLFTGTTAEDEARARQLLGEVGLGERLEHRPAELSGGEKQRAALARAHERQPRPRRGRTRRRARRRAAPAAGDHPHRRHAQRGVGLASPRPLRAAGKKPKKSDEW